MDNDGEPEELGWAEIIVLLLFAGILFILDTLLEASNKLLRLWRKVFPRRIEDGKTYVQF